MRGKEYKDWHNQIVYSKFKREVFIFRDILH